MAIVTQAEIDARNERLQGLKTAVDDFAENEVKRIENETKFLKSVLTGRGADKTAVVNLLDGTKALEEEITRYLEVGP